MGASQIRGATILSDLCYDLFLTRLGWVGALASGRGLRRLTLRPEPHEALEELGPEVARASQAPEALEEVHHRVEAYCDGEGTSLEDIALDVGDAPPFFKAAWEACRSIPPGETRSYAWLAAEAGRPGAYRAAGQAMARNRLAIVIPCHRVIGSDGGLQGYGGGVKVKAWLLEMEQGWEEPQDRT